MHAARSDTRRSRPLPTVIALLAATLPAPATAQPGDEPRPIVEVLQQEAAELTDFVTSPLARAFLAATQGLASAPARTLYRDGSDGRWLSAREAEQLPDEARALLAVHELDADRYYTTKYGSPLAYCRALDLLGEAGLSSLEGGRVLDFGYGTVGHLRLMASLGAEAVGVDVDSFLSALYSEPDDQGPVDTPAGADGHLALVSGRWPADEATVAAVGGGFDLFLSKNTLKRGYIHPERETDPRRLIDLGVDDATFLQHVARCLDPGGLVLIYNLSPPPAPPDEPYIPWADGRCPFSAEQWAAAGLELLAFDVDDSVAARELGRRLGWGDSMDLEQGLFGHYTLARKPVADTSAETETEAEAGTEAEAEAEAETGAGTEPETEAEAEAETEAGTEPEPETETETETGTDTDSDSDSDDR